MSLCNTCTVTLLHAISYIPTSYRLHGLCVAKSNNHHLYCIHKKSLTHFTYTKPNPNWNKLYNYALYAYSYACTISYTNYLGVAIQN